MFPFPTAPSVASLLAAAGKQPLLQALTIILGTFVLEDAATVLAAMRAAEGGISIPVALLALYAGIVLGDLGLYGLGALSARIGWIARRVPPARSRALADWVRGRVFRVVVISRFIPGMRLPTYTACGFLGVDLRQFAIAAVLATLIWTSMLFALAMRVGDLFIAHLGVWRWAGAIGFALVIILAGRLLAGLHTEPAE